MLAMIMLINAQLPLTTFQNAIRDLAAASSSADRALNIPVHVTKKELLQGKEAIDKCHQQVEDEKNKTVQGPVTPITPGAQSGNQGTAAAAQSATAAGTSQYSRSFLTSLAQQLLDTSGLLLKYSDQTPRTVRSAADKIRYDMPDVLFYLKDAAKYLHDLDTSPLASNKSETLGKRAQPAASTAQLPSATSMLAEVHSMLTENPPWRGGSRRGRGGRGRGRGHYNRNSGGDRNPGGDGRVCYDCGNNDHMSGDTRCPRPSWRTLKRRCDQASSSAGTQASTQEAYQAQQTPAPAPEQPQSFGAGSTASDQ